MSIAKQVIPTYTNHSRPLIPDGIHLFFERGLRGERSQTCPHMLSAKQGRIWYHFYNVFGMTRSGIEPTNSRSRGCFKEIEINNVHVFKLNILVRKLKFIVCVVS